MTNNKFYNETAHLSVNIINLTEYNNNGKLIGGWISLPIKKKDFRDFLFTIGNPEKVKILDYKDNLGLNGLKIEKYKSIKEMNQLAKRMESIIPHEVNIFNALYKTLGDFESALNCLESGDYTFYEDMTMEEVAREHIEDCYDIPSYLGNYIDYKALAYDMRYDGYCETDYGVIYTD